MSASSARKKRLEQSQIPASQTPKKKKKLSQGWIFGITIALIIALLVGGILIYRTVRNNRTVLTVGDHKVSVKEFNYFYSDVYNAFGSYASFFSIETGVPLDEQYITSTGKANAEMFGVSTDILAGKEPVNDVYDVTWAQLIASLAKDNAVTYYTIYNAAMADESFEIDEHLKHEIDESVEQLQTYADQNGESLNGLIKRVFGSGCNESGYRHYREVVLVAQHYTGPAYSDEEIAARYNESPEDFDVATYYLYSISPDTLPTEPAPTDEEGEVTEPTEEEGEATEPTEEEATEPEESEEEATEPEESEEEATEPEESEEGSEPTEPSEEDEPTEPTEEDEPSEEDKQKAEELAKAMEQDFDENNERASIRTDETREAVTSASTEEAAAWLFDTAKDGDVKLFENEETHTYYVLKLVNKDDYQTLNCLVLSVAADAADAVPVEGEKTAAEKIDAIKAALDADPTEANFRALMEEYGAEPEVLKNRTRTSFKNVSKDALTWCLEGFGKDQWIMTEISDGTTYFFYCTDLGDNYHTAAVKSTLFNEWTESAVDAAKEACGYDEAAAMTANVGVAYNAN